MKSNSDHLFTNTRIELTQVKLSIGKLRYRKIDEKRRNRKDIKLEKPKIRAQHFLQNNQKMSFWFPKKIN